MAEAIPPMRPSAQADERQLGLAAAQGEAYERAIEQMLLGVAQDGAEVRAGDYIVGYAIGNAEGGYAPAGKGLAWQEPLGTMHLYVTVRDGADGRFIPDLRVSATLLAPDGQEIAAQEQQFTWHPWIHHYGSDWVTPPEGEYLLTIRIDPPLFTRHDRENGQRYAEAVEASFMMYIRGEKR